MHYIRRRALGPIRNRRKTAPKNGPKSKHLINIQFKSIKTKTFTQPNFQTTDINIRKRLSDLEKHLTIHEVPDRSDLFNESHFKILRKCQGKFDCLLFETD